ncbi:MAG: glycerate kinase [Opitutales bacterium]|nr:glycerate kinase [Opitutales bacterium]
MRVLVAFDKFKDSMSADVACERAAQALSELLPEWEIETAPLTDGGEGFVRILTTSLGGELVEAPVNDALGRETTAVYGRVDMTQVPPAALRILRLGQSSGTLAVIGMAEASGLEALRPEERDPWQATTYGTGQLIRHANESGATAVLLGLGGSASNDCGLGALEAMGVLAYAHDHQPVRNLAPAKWNRIASLGGLYNLKSKSVPLRLACDVANPLLGPNGATAVYGPQKGLKPVDFDRLERAMAKTADRLLGLAGIPETAFAARKTEPGAGAAGGIGFGLRTLLPNAAFVPGFETVAALLRLDDKTRRADIILTGEGKFDESSLHGKAPAKLIEQARGEAAVWVFAGRVALPAGRRPPRLSADRVVAITPENMPLDVALQRGPELLEAAVHRHFRA